MLRQSLFVISGLILFRFYQHRKLEIARESRNDKVIMLDDIWTEQEIESIKVIIWPTPIFLRANFHISGLKLKKFRSKFKISEWWTHSGYIV